MSSNDSKMRYFVLGGLLESRGRQRHFPKDRIQLATYLSGEILSFVEDLIEKLLRHRSRINIFLNGASLMPGQRGKQGQEQNSSKPWPNCLSLFQVLDHFAASRVRSASAPLLNPDPSLSFSCGPPRSYPFSLWNGEGDKTPKNPTAMK